MRVRVVAGLVGVIVIAGGVAVWLTTTTPGRRRVGDGRAVTAVVRVATDRPGRRVPPSFLGLSVEWDSVDAYAGPPGRRRRALPRLLAPLRRAARAPLALRVGGDTADQAWWDPGHRRPRPRTVLQDITPRTLGSVAWLARALGGPATLGLNLALDDPGNAVALARAARRRLPAGALDALEIGNEPDLYTQAHTFRVPGHVHRRLRKHRRYTVADYERDTGAYMRALRARLHPLPRLAVAGFAGTRWWNALPRLLDAWPVRNPILSGHLYALPDCGAPTPSASWLMSARASRGSAARLDPLAALARRRGLTMRVPELNSAACGGRAGLSDTFPAALWLADTLFALLREGADQVDVHTWDHARYAPFAVRHGGAQPRPPLAGMLAFARAAPRASRLAPVTVEGTGLRAWATVDARGTVRVLLIAPGGARARVVARHGRRCARLWVATNAAMTTRPSCSAGGGYDASLPRRSLAVLTVPRAAA